MGRQPPVHSTAALAPHRPGMNHISRMQKEKMKAATIDEAVRFTSSVDLMSEGLVT